MKILYILIFLVSGGIFSQQIDYNVQKGFVAEGYDVVEYFKNNAEKGDKKFTAEFNGVKFKFSSKENLDVFKKSPKKYVPQYGGYCAYAIGKSSEKVAINPKTFEIRDGKLYLFYNAWGTNTLKMWMDENPKNLQEQADKNWKKISKKES